MRSRDKLVKLVLLEVCDEPSILLRPRELAARLGVSERMARTYRDWLVEAGYVVVVYDAEGWRVELTEKARQALRYYYEKIERALSPQTREGEDDLENLRVLLEELFG